MYSRHIVCYANQTKTNVRMLHQNMINMTCTNKNENYPLRFIVEVSNNVEALFTMWIAGNLEN